MTAAHHRLVEREFFALGSTAPTSTCWKIMDPDIRNNPEAKRYELLFDGLRAVVTYNLNDPNLMITETLVPVSLEGKGLASRLAKHVIADAAARNLLVLPVCPYFSAYLQKHPEHAETVHPIYRGILGI